MGRKACTRIHTASQSLTNEEVWSHTLRVPPTMSEESFSSSGDSRRRRSSSSLGYVAAATLAGLGIMALAYPYWRSQQRTLDASGFNIPQIAETQTKPLLP